MSHLDYRMVCNAVAKHHYIKLLALQGKVGDRARGTPWGRRGGNKMVGRAPIKTSFWDSLPSIAKIKA